jgi:hypothetical protein
MSEMHPVVIWLVAVVLALQLLEYLLRLAKGLAARRRAAPGRARFAELTPLQKIETFRLDALDEEALRLFMDAVGMPREERERLRDLLGIGRASAASRQPEMVLTPTPGEAGGEQAEVLSLPTSKAPPRQGPRELSARS